MGVLDVVDPAAATASQARLARDLLSRMAAPDYDKLSLYAGPAPIWTMNNGASTITNGVLRVPRRLALGGSASPKVAWDDDPNYRYQGIGVLNFGTTYPDYLFARPALLIGGSSQAAYPSTSVSFLYDGQTFELYGKAYQATTTIRMRIDGKLVTLGNQAISTGAGAGSLNYWKCDLGSAQLRLIEIENLLDPSFGGIVAEPTATLIRGPEKSIRVAFITDSIGGGAGGYSRVTSWCGWVNELIGGDTAFLNLGVGGTGYLAGQGSSAYLDRIGDAIAAKPDVLFIQGGQNDGGQTVAAMSASVQATLQTYRAALPNTLIFVTGTYNAGTPNSLKMQHDAAMRTIAIANGCYFISWVDPTDAAVNGNTPAWIASTSYSKGDQLINPSGVPVTVISSHTSTATYDDTKFKPNSLFYGTGRVGATTGDGNADFVVTSDAIHPTLRGAELLGRHTYGAMRKHLKAIAQTV